MKVLITGGTGLVGSALQTLLLTQGIEVVILSRTVKKSTIKGLSYALWNVNKGEIDAQAVCSVDHIIHLAGANVGAKRWTKKQREQIVTSRVASAALLYNTLSENKHQVQTFVSASGTGYYGTVTTENIYKETDAKGADFLAKVCEVWEQAAFKFKDLGIRSVCLRTAVVFAKENSALQKMTQPIKLGIGAPLGTGKQILPFIHVHDLCNMYLHAIQNTTMVGAYNAVAENDTNTQITKAIAKQLRKPLWLPNIPAFVLKLLFGKMAVILLKGSAIDNTKIKETGFQFQYPSLESVLEGLV